MHASRYPLRIKIGISKHPKSRAKQIRKIGTIRILLALPMLGADKLEQTLKTLFKFAQMPIKHVSGGTEFYSVFVAPFFAFFMLFCFLIQIFLTTLIFYLCVS